MNKLLLLMHTGKGIPISTKQAGIGISMISPTSKRSVTNAGWWPEMKKSYKSMRNLPTGNNHPVHEPGPERWPSGGSGRKLVPIYRDLLLAINDAAMYRTNPPIAIASP